jgi:hypothetical protein
MAKAKTPRTPKPKSEKVAKKVLRMPEAVAAASGNGNNSYPPAGLESEIRLRAYELFESRGYTHGLHEQDWFEAEREVLARQSRKHTA